MKTAQRFFDDFIRDAQILVGGTVVLREDEPRYDSDPNWKAAVRSLADERLYNEHLADLRKRHPSIDWSDIKERDGKWRVIRAVKTV